MINRENIKKAFIYFVLILYIFFLVKILLLSRVSHPELRSINLIPFHSIMKYLSGSTVNLKRFAFSNLGGNILIFVPLGTYLPLFKKDKRVINNLFFIFIVSLIVEIIQGVFAIGASDIDDIILNSFGGFLGILFFKLLLSLLGDDKKIRTIISLLSVLGLPILLYLLFMVKLRL
ncbi:MAG: VanZ family protein [Solirubrobacterales bacterium]